jgi:hypothetical protein
MFTIVFSRHYLLCRFRRLAAFAALLTFIGGCGDGITKLSLQGTVSYQDSPIEKGRIDFIPVDGTTGPSVGAPIAQGSYLVAADQGVLAMGTYEVRITAYRKTGRTEPNRIDHGGPPIEIEENFIPPIYNAQSTLKVRVSDFPDKGKADFPLSRSPPK